MVDSLRADIKEKLEDFVDTFIVRGADPVDVLDANIEATKILRETFDRDSAPAEDASAQFDQEPSNDWQAAVVGNRGSGDA